MFLMSKVPMYPLFVSAAGCDVCGGKPRVVKVLPESAASRLAWYWPLPHVTNLTLQGGTWPVSIRRWHVAKLTCDGERGRGCKVAARRLRGQLPRLVRVPGPLLGLSTRKAALSSNPIETRAKSRSTRGGVQGYLVHKKTPPP